MGTQIPMTTLTSTIQTSTAPVTASGNNAAGKTGPALPVNSSPAGNIATASNGSTAQTPGAIPGHASASQGTTGSHMNVVAQPQTTSTSSAQSPQTPVVSKSRKLTHLSHISAATWIGVGLALGALVVAVYYGEPMWRVAKWTALNDFRASCVSDRDLGLQESAKCKLLLASPAKPPPVVKRAFDNAGNVAKVAALRLAVLLGLPVVTVVVYWLWFRIYAEDRPRPAGSMARLAPIYTWSMPGTGTALIDMLQPTEDHDECVIAEINDPITEDSDYESSLNLETMHYLGTPEQDEEGKGFATEIAEANKLWEAMQRSKGAPLLSDTLIHVPEASDNLESDSVPVTEMRERLQEYMAEQRVGELQQDKARVTTSAVRRWMTNLRRRKPQPQVPSGMHEVKNAIRRNQGMSIYPRPGDEANDFGMVQSQATGRRTVASWLINFAENVGMAQKKSYDDSGFRRGRAMGFPEVPGEQMRNPQLHQIPEQWVSRERLVAA